MASNLQLAAVSPSPKPVPAPPQATTPPAWLGTALLLLVALAPIPFGSNRPFWWSLLGLATAGLMATYLVLISRGLRPAFRFGQIAALLVPFGLAVLWALFQILPLAAAANALVHPVWGLAATALGHPEPGTISMTPHESLTGVLRLLTYAGIFWLALELGRHRGFADRTLRWTAYAGLAYAVYGLAMHVLGLELILWFPKIAYQGFLTSTFVNRNSYATYADLGVLCALALLFDALRGRGIRGRSRKAAFASFVEKLTGPALLPLIALVAISAALLQTGSRAGLMSLALGLAVFAAASAYAQLIRGRTAFLAILLIGVTLAGVIALRGGAFVDRLQSGTLQSDRDARAEIYDFTIGAIKDNTLLGTGLGTYPDVFNMYRTADFDTLGPIGNAHSSYLGNALELGVPAALLILAALAALTEKTVTGLRRRRRGRLFPVLGVSMLALVALHSAVDFSLEIPAVAVSFAALMGVTCAQSYRSPKRRKRKPKLQIVTA